VQISCSPYPPFALKDRLTILDRLVLSAVDLSVMLVSAFANGLPVTVIDNARIAMMTSEIKLETLTIFARM